MLDKFIYKNSKKLRCGYTTGTCAAAATKAAVRMLLTGKEIDTIDITTPKGIIINLDVLDINLTPSQVSCCVRKDAGDDADVTDGILIYSEVSFGTSGIKIDGGTGVGKVTRPGLEQPVGAAAINSTPRRMIRETVECELEAAGYDGGINVIIKAPAGVEIAGKTFNPKLGIEGGISILGTSGIVEPMSEQAIIDTIRIDIGQKKALGNDILLVSPGNYGQAFTKDTFNINLEKSVKCSNFIGDTLDIAVASGFTDVLLIGHIGKLVKLAGGIMNTHSKVADGRFETLSACVACAFSPDEFTAVSSGITSRDIICIASKILTCNTTDDAIKLLDTTGILKPVMKVMMDRIIYYINKRTLGKINVQVVVFSNIYGTLSVSDGAAMLISRLTDGNP